MPSNQSNQMLPEPFALYDGEKWYANEEAAICSCANMQKLQKVYTEQQVLALLANGGQVQTDVRDAARLDWLDAQVKCHPVYNGYTWQEAGYEDNRGLVCAIQKPKQKLTARKAIDAAIAAAKGSK